VLNDDQTGRAAVPHLGATDRIPADSLLAALREHAIFALDGNGRIASWNPAAASLSGYDAGDVVGQPFTILGESAGPAGLARILEVARRDGAHNHDRWWRRRDGRLVWVEELIHPLNLGGDIDGYVVVARDASQRAASDQAQLESSAREEAGRGREHRLRGELQAAERRASFLAEASSILVATSLDFDSTLKALARLAVSRLGEWCVLHAVEGDDELRRAEVAHRDPELEPPLEAAVGSTLHDEWERAVRIVISTGQSQVLEGIVDESWFEPGPGDGAASQVLEQISGGSVMITPLMGRGRVLGAITFGSIAGQRSFDDDDLMLAEELGRRAAIALDNARLYRDAQEANRAKSDFLAVISHELRTPLNAIMGYSDLLDARISGDLTDKQRRQISRIRTSARHLLQLIEEILSFARIESGRDEIALDLVNGADLLEDAAAVIEHMAHSKGLEFRVEDQGDVTLETDPAKARQILLNLLSNAVKFTEHGTITLRLSQRDEHAVFDVIDTGIGIGTEQLERIFDPFWQAENPNTRRVGGTGLGLSVARRFTRLLRGELQVSSEPGRGTRFSLILPLRLTGGHGDTKVAPTVGVPKRVPDAPGATRA
jgi:PAS domain S-box-containing protein